jgi:peptidase YpeB-like protein
MELFVMAVWVVHLLPRMAAHIAFRAQTIRIPSVMRKIRSGIAPAVLVLIGFAPFTQAHSTPGERPSGAAVQETSVVAEVNDGISLDEAVARAERQYHARVVRTDVQDEDGRKVYVLKLLSEDGRVFTVRIDAQSGRSR